VPDFEEMCESMKNAAGALRDANVPFVLGGSSEEPIAAPAPVGVDADATQVESAVVVEQTGIRSYQKRLAALRKKNPFDQQYSGPKPGQESEVAVDDGSAAVSLAGEDQGSQPVSSTSPATVPAPASEPVSQSSDPSVSTGAEPEPGDSGSSAGVSAGKKRFYTGTVDLSFGALGDAKRYKRVKRFTNLPNDNVPVVTFLGLSVDSDRAYFLFTPAVTRMDGDGACPGQGSGCQLLELAIGDQQTLTVGGTESSAPRVSAPASAVAGSEAVPASTVSPSSQREGQSVSYRLKLLDTKIVEISDPGDE